LADNYDVPFHKVASGLAPSMGFLAAVARRKKLTLISTGLIEKIEAVTNVFGVWKCPFVLNHCVALYPAPPESMNMRYLWTLRQHATCEGLGYSSHENGIISTILAVFEGVEWIEHHVTLDKTLHGGDQSFSLEPKELAVMVNTVRKAELMLGDPQRKLTGVEKAPVLLPEDICEIINNI